MGAAQMKAANRSSAKARAGGAISGLLAVEKNYRRLLKALVLRSGWIAGWGRKNGRDGAVMERAGWVLCTAQSSVALNELSLCEL